MPKVVLIIDDDPQIALALKTRLRALGYEVFHAVNGLTGVEEAALHRPDVILLDIRMPDIDGYEACVRIKRQPQLEGTPIIFLSANSQDSFRKRALEAGGSMFISKPYRAADVMKAIETLTKSASIFAAATGEHVAQGST